MSECNLQQSPGRQALSDMFAIKNGLKHGDAVLPLLYNFALEYAIGMV